MFGSAASFDSRSSLDRTQQPRNTYLSFALSLATVREAAQRDFERVSFRRVDESNYSERLSKKRRIEETIRQESKLPREDRVTLNALHGQVRRAAIYISTDLLLGTPFRPARVFLATRRRRRPVSLAAHRRNDEEITIIRVCTGTRRAA